MSRFLGRFTRIQWMALGLMLIGVALMAVKGAGLLNSAREARYAVENNFSAGDLDPALIRPWMNVRYISSAYAVPQKYLFEALGVTPGKETSLIALERLNKQHNLGKNGEKPAILQKVVEAVNTYRANPVTTGLIEREVEDWMTIQYVANSTGITAEELAASAGIPLEGNLNKPIGVVADQTDYPGGAKALANALNEFVQQFAPQPEQP